MHYICLIYTNEAQDANASEAEQQAVMGAYYQFSEAVNKAGINKGGDALMPTSMATTVRVRDGKTITTDGPFAETKEQLGGYYILDCANLDEAIEWAAKIPGAAIGSIEVRPVMVFDQ
ncbi:MAG: YciI family protein [Caldilineaceae bacterium]|nr:YciI family protein [Caldilineaceae bacterium]